MVQAKINLENYANKILVALDDMVQIVTILAILKKK